jgi:amino acid adenylation domain-containing protein
MNEAKLTDRVANLSPAKRALLEKHLRERGFQFPPLQTIPRRVEREFAPLSFAQQRLWFLNQLEPESPAYNEGSALRLTGHLDLDALHKAINHIVKRHEVLRTNFVTVDGNLVQKIAHRRTVEIPCIDLSSHAGEERDAEVERLIGETIRRPFDLTQDLMLRPLLIRLADRQHILIRVQHHIASDGWSSQIFRRELSVLYEAFAKGETPALPEPPIQYADYAVWQRQWLQGETLESHLSYWKKQLSGVPVLELPVDRPRPSVQSYRSARLSFAISKTVSEKLKTLSRNHGVTLFMTLLAAFQTLLHRYTGQEDIAVGSAIANRTRAEIEGLIGFFVNTLVLRTDLSGNPSFRELMARVRNVALDAYEHQDLPFEKLVEELNPDRKSGRTPLFQVMFVFQNVPRSDLELRGLDVKSVRTDSDTAKFDLTLSVVEGAGELKASLAYNTDLFDAETIRRMLGHFQRLLEGIVADSEGRLSELAILTEAERRQIVVEWNDTGRDYPKDKCIHELFEEQVERTPDAVAVVFEGQQLTYRELNARANQLAHYLRTLGVGPDVPVGVCVERSLEMVIGLLGILKAGGAYVPLDPDYPKERIAFMLEDAQVPILLTQRRLIQRLPEHAAKLIQLDAEREVIAANCQNPVSGARGENIAYVIFTSGSTGKPKGVPVTHTNVERLFTATEAWYHFDEHDVWTLFHSYAFDFSVWEIWGALLYGGRLVVVPYLVSRSPERFYELLRTEQVTVLNQTPSAFRQLIQFEDVRGAASDLALRYVIFGGEALELHSLKPWFSRHGDQRPQLVNMYGITETTVHVTYRPITLANISITQGSVIGVRIPDLHVYILDQVRELVPVGVAGELYIGGRGVARGYLHRPELTAEKFIPNTFSDTPGARMYKTGDLARYLPDGNIEFLGRIDHQVKLRGFRIELGEIEAVLSEHPMVRETVVVAREDRPSEKRLVAYVVSRKEQTCTTSELRHFLKQKLPEHMVPSAFVLLDILPLTPNGKVDRKALPAPDQSRPEMEEGYVLPRTPVEELLTGIWAEVLKLEKIGIHNNFFDLGGHSLLATQVVSRIRESLQVELPLRVLFEKPTVIGLAEQIEETRRKAQGAQALPLIAVSREEDLPLSFAQQRLWFLDQLEPGSAVYNVPGALRISGPLDVAALERCFEEVTRRHEALRTVFSKVHGEPVQTILPSLKLPISIVDLSDLPEYEREAEVRRRAVEGSQRYFDLTTGPLVRVAVLRLGQQDHVLLLTMHHIVSDGWSAGILFRELSVLYEAFTQGKPSPLNDLPIQYADFASWQRGWLQGEVLEGQLSYWKTQLEGAPRLQLPTDRPRPPVRSYRGGKRSFVLDKKLTDALTALSRQENVTLFMTLLAAFQLLLHRYTAQEDIVIGSPIAGRTRPEIESLIGFFVNTLVLRNDFSGNPTFREILSRVRKVCLDAYTHQDVPFEKLVEELRPERSLGQNPLFQVMFVLQNAPADTLRFAGLELSPIHGDGDQAKFDLTLTMREENEGLRAVLNYSADLFDGTTIDRMIGHFQTLVEGIVADPEQRVSSLPILTEAERRRLLVEWNDTKKEYPNDKCVHELFEAQVERTPDAVALVYKDEQLTYRQLNERANRLANYLKARGVGPEVPVAVCMERSPEMITALLAILKAGGAYVPLDPEYPNERLGFILDDVRAKVVVTLERLAERFSQHSRSVFCMDRDREGIVQQPRDNLPNETGPGNLAYVIYTSGSTGKPKGVEILHRGVVRLLFGVEYAQLDAGRTFVHLAPTSFDASTFEIWGALLHGAKCVLAPQGFSSPADLRDLLQRHKVTTLWLTASLFNLVIDQLPEALSQVHELLIGGEALSVPHVQRALSLLPSTQIINGYGPTESATFTCCYRIPSKLDDALTSIPIGRPIGNTKVYILDSHLNPTPIGMPGELYIGGAGLARGYVNAAELTSQKFIPNPFATTPRERLYKTGDLARRLPDGNIEFLGRLDHQVKIRGFRIELGEIESALRQHGGIRETVVAVRQDGDREKQLVAYIAPKDDAPTTHDLRRFLRQKLPGYMIPSAFVYLPALPLAANGKTDYGALPEATSHGTRDHNEYAAPRDETERVLCRIWSEVLGVDRVGLDDDFFAIGGHSLLAAKLFARLDESFGRSLPLGVLFKAPTVRLLAEHYRSTPEPKARLVIVPLWIAGTLPPIFAIPGVFGNVICFAELSRELGSDQPFYGLQSVGLDGAEAPLDSIEQMAKLYVREIRSVQAHGPYAIIGVCFGATVAYEMARQLLASGETVGFLGLLDPTYREANIERKNPASAPRIFKRAAAFNSLLVSRLRLYREEMKRLGAKDRLKYLAAKFRLLQALIGNNNALKGAERELNQIEVYRANLLALDSYHREPLDGRLRSLEIFETALPGKPGAQKKLDWSAFWKGPTKRYRVPGKDSGDMLTGKNAQAVAVLLAERLRAVFGEKGRNA